MESAPSVPTDSTPTEPVSNHLPHLTSLSSLNVKATEISEWLNEPLNIEDKDDTNFVLKLLTYLLDHPECSVDEEMENIVKKVINFIFKKTHTKTPDPDYLDTTNAVTDLFVKYANANIPATKEVAFLMTRAVSQYLRDMFKETFTELFGLGITNATTAIEDVFIQNINNPNVLCYVCALPKNNLTKTEEYTKSARALILKKMGTDFLSPKLIEFYRENVNTVDVEFAQQISDALFTPPNLENMKLPIIQNENTRIELLKLLEKYFVIGGFNKELTDNCVNNIKPIQMARVTDATFKKFPFVGLENQGCTCYINSLVQQLYMNPYFRNKLLNVKGNENSVNINAFQKLFTELHETVVRYVDTKDFISHLKGDDGKELNPYIQMDTHEFLTSTLDEIEKELKQIDGQKNIIEECFSGTLSNQIVSKECEHVSETEEKTICLQMSIITFGEPNKTSLDESFASMIKGDELSGDNKYFCEKCNKKVDAVRRSCIKTPPNTLILHIKRFEFDYETMDRIKLNNRYEFPRELDLFKYSAEFLKDPTIENKGDFQFKLVGVLIHLGSLDSGHYYSYIKDQETGDEWFVFNDDLIEKFDLSKLEEQTYGGDATKRFSAYILFYQKVIPIVEKVDVVYPIELKNKVIQDNLSMMSNSVILANCNMSDYLIQQMRFCNNEPNFEFTTTAQVPTQCNKMEIEIQNGVSEQTIRDLIEICVHYELTHATLLMQYPRQEMFQIELLKMVEKYPDIVNTILKSEVEQKENELLKKTREYVISSRATINTLHFFSQIFGMGDKELVIQYAEKLIKFFASVKKTGDSFWRFCLFLRKLCENIRVGRIFQEKLITGVGYISCYNALSCSEKVLKFVPDMSDLYFAFFTALASNYSNLDESSKARSRDVEFLKSTVRWVEKSKNVVNKVEVVEILLRFLKEITKIDILSYIVRTTQILENSKEGLPDVVSRAFVLLSQTIVITSEEEEKATLFLQTMIGEMHGYHYPTENICYVRIVKGMIEKNPFVTQIAQKELLTYIQRNPDEAYRCVLYFNEELKREINELYEHLLGDYVKNVWNEIIIPRLVKEKLGVSFLYEYKGDPCYRLKDSISMLHRVLKKYGTDNFELKFFVDLFTTIITSQRRPNLDYNLLELAALCVDISITHKDLFDAGSLRNINFKQNIWGEEEKRVEKCINDSYVEIMKNID